MTLTYLKRKRFLNIAIILNTKLITCTSYPEHLYAIHSACRARDLSGADTRCNPTEILWGPG